MDSQSQVRVSGDTTTDKRTDSGHGKQLRKQVAHVKKGQRSETTPNISSLGTCNYWGGDSPLPVAGRLLRL